MNTAYASISQGIEVIKTEVIKTLNYEKETEMKRISISLILILPMSNSYP